MTTDGNYLVQKLNTIHIPTINTVISQVTVPVTTSFATVGMYYDSKKFYTVSPSSNIVYSSHLNDPLNLVSHKNAQVGDQSEFINNIYSTSIDDYFYAYGTKDDLGGTASGSIYRAHINSPLSWADTGDTLPSASGDGMVYVSDTDIYVIGGINTGSTVLSTIDTASRATPTTFTTSGNTLPAPRVYGMLATIGTTIYMYGGSSDGTASTSTIYEASTSDPTSWTDTGDSIPQTIHAAAIYVSDTHVWIFGGQDSVGGTALDTIYRATLAAPTTFLNVGTLPYEIDGNKVFVSGTNLYMIGSALSGSGVMKASLSDLTDWEEITVSTLATAQTSTHLINNETNLYILGGVNSGGTASNVIQTATLAKPLEITNSVSTLPAALSGGEVIKTSEYYYIIGGNRHYRK